jgi:hypothetical protein
MAKRIVDYLDYLDADPYRIWNGPHEKYRSELYHFALHSHDFLLSITRVVTFEMPGSSGVLSRARSSIKRGETYRQGNEQRHQNRTVKHPHA